MNMNGGKQKQRGKYSDAYCTHTTQNGVLRNKHDSQSTVDPGDIAVTVPVVIAQFRGEYQRNPTKIYLIPDFKLGTRMAHYVSKVQPHGFKQKQ